MTTDNPTTRPIAARSFLWLLGICAVSLAVQIGQNQLKAENTGLMDVLQGKTTLQLEGSFNDTLIFKGAATDFWGALRYGLLKTGSKGVVIGEDGWLYTSEEFDAPAGFNENIKTNLNFIKQTKRELAKKGITLKLLLLPAKTRVYPEHLGSHRWPEQREKMWEVAQNEIPASMLLNPLPLMQEVKNDITLFMQTDTHWSPEGANLVAQFVAQEVRDISLVQSPYLTTQEESKPYSGDLARFVPTGWARPFIGPREDTLSVWKTESQATADLFTEPEISVALVGTSYSALEQWHFAGFLQQALQADVLNVADEGGGPIKPMRKFMYETDFATSNIKLVIWEFPERFLPVDYSKEIHLSHRERSAKAKPETGEGADHAHPKSSTPILTSPRGRGVKEDEGVK